MTDGLPVSTWLLGERGSQGSELSQKVYVWYCSGWKGYVSSKLGMRASRCRCPVRSSTQDRGVEEIVCPKKIQYMWEPLSRGRELIRHQEHSVKSGLGKPGLSDQISPTARFSE